MPPHVVRNMSLSSFYHTYLGGSNKEVAGQKEVQYDMSISEAEIEMALFEVRVVQVCVFEFFWNEFEFFKKVLFDPSISYDYATWTYSTIGRP